MANIQDMDYVDSSFSLVLELDEEEENENGQYLDGPPTLAIS